MDPQEKTPRKRVANFTADEKALLAQLVKNKPIIESKLSDGKAVAKKQTAWELLTKEFNCHANVTKRETISLKRAWDNMKAWTRKTRAMERGNLIRTGGGPSLPPLSPQHGAIISMIEEAAPVMICEISNNMDTDGMILNSINSEGVDFVEDDSQQILTEVAHVSEPSSSQVFVEEEKNLHTDSVVDVNDQYDVQFDDDMPIKTEQSKRNKIVKKNLPTLISQDQNRRPTDYIRREAVIRIRHLENKKKMEIQILRTQLEVEEIKKRAVLLEEERNKILLEKTKIEFNMLMKSD